MVEQEKTSEILELLTKQDIDGKHSDIIAIGEVPYQSNLRAIKALDIKNDRKKGLAEAKLMSEGLGLLIEELESFKDASEKIANHSVTVLR